MTERPEAAAAGGPVQAAASSAAGPVEAAASSAAGPVEAAASSAAGPVEAGASTTAWAAEPEIADDRLREATGRGWDEWRELVDGAGLREAGHTAIAAWVASEHGVEGWWAQAVTIGYERIVGLRQRGQMADGTFTTNASRTLELDADTLRARLLDGRDALFPGMKTELRSRTTSKSLRIAFPEGVALIALTPASRGRTTVTVQHEKLPTPEAVERSTAYWSTWLTGLAGT